MQQKCQDCALLEPFAYAGRPSAPLRTAPFPSCGRVALACLGPELQTVLGRAGKKGGGGGIDPGLMAVAVVGG